MQMTLGKMEVDVYSTTQSRQCCITDNETFS